MSATVTLTYWQLFLAIFIPSLVSHWIVAMCRGWIDDGS